MEFNFFYNGENIKLLIFCLHRTFDRNRLRIRFAARSVTEDSTNGKEELFSVGDHCLG